MTLDHPVLSSLLPVVLLIAIGFVAGKARLIRGEGVRDLSSLVFMVLAPALLFRTMAFAAQPAGWTSRRWRLYLPGRRRLVVSFRRDCGSWGFSQPLGSSGSGGHLQQYGDDRRAAGLAGVWRRRAVASCSR
jgi:hypothetical protein